MSNVLKRNKLTRYNISSPSDYISIFQKTKYKIAIQKNGELTKLSEKILKKDFGITINKSQSKTRRLTYIAKGNNFTFGIFLAKNIDLCNLVNTGLIDFAIVGTDNFYEYPLRRNLAILKSYENYAKWPLVIAKTLNSPISKLDQLKTIATQFPKHVKRILNKKGIKNTKIIQSGGSCEGYLHLSKNIDAIVDFSVTGKSLKIII